MYVEYYYYNMHCSHLYGHKTTDSILHINQPSHHTYSNEQYVRKYHKYMQYPVQFGQTAKNTPKRARTLVCHYGHVTCSQLKYAL